MKDLPYTCDNSGLYTFTRPITKKEAIEIACSFLKTKYDKNPTLKSSNEVIDYLRLQLSDCQRELFVCIFLDTQLKVLSFETLFWGTVNSNTIYLREVARRALQLNATSIIFAHNHPSGNPVPSQEDKNLTEQTKDALALINITVLDHIIVAGDMSISFKDRGIL